MKTPLNWISLYTPLQTLLEKKSITELAHEYSVHIAEIDGIEGHRIDKVVVGKVIKCEKHPESTKLSICEVNVGNGVIETILTGAPNIVDATYVAVALVGAKLSEDFTIGERKMAGMMSRGMICGADEIWLSKEPDGGIMILEEIWDTALLEEMIGKSVFDLKVTFPWINGEKYEYTLWDTTFEIDNKFITNRPDLFGVYGNAREWGAVFDLDFHPYASDEKIKSINEFSLKILTNRCLAYHAIKMEDITVGKMPLGIRLMMERADLTTKMDLVDITNCILGEFGQPMHVFDADKVVGGIQVRLAKTGEKILALNGVEYALTEDDMVIADDNWPIAIAGVIGGMDSAVSKSTTSVIWESATFDAVSVRLTAQRHGIRTDASTRYEKSLDPLLAGFATSRIFDYLRFLDKNINVTAMASYLDEKQVNHITIDVDYDFISMKAGTQIENETVNQILKKLGFEFSTYDSHISVKVPSWRASKDVSIKEDIAEEVIRIYGYERIAPTPLDANFSISQKNSEHALRDVVLDFWQHAHWSEVYNYSFTNAALEKRILSPNMDDAVGIMNAYNVDYTHMRRSLSVRLFESIANNRKNDEHLSFFEIGRVYSKDIGYTQNVDELLTSISTPKPYGEIPMVAGATTRQDVEHLRWQLEDFLSRILGFVPPLSEWSGLSFLHPGVSGEYRQWELVMLTFWKVHPETAEAFDIPADTLYWEADMRVLLDGFLNAEKRLAPISKFQSIPRELNFVMGRDVTTGPIAKMIEAHHPYIQNVIVDSIYEDESKLGKDKKSVNFSFTLQSHEDTISDDEALRIQDAIIALMKTHNYELRSI